MHGYAIIITLRTLGRVFGLAHDFNLPLSISDEDMKEAWDIMRLGKPMTEASFTRKEFSPKVYLLSDVVDKVLMCKTGNKDKFTEEQLCITAAILLRKDLNWGGLLHSQPKQFVMSVAQTSSPKRKFVRIMNYLVQAICLDMVISTGKLISHSTNKEINKKTLCFLEKVVHVSAEAMSTAEESDPTDALLPHLPPRQPKKGGLNST